MLPTDRASPSGRRPRRAGDLSGLPGGLDLTALVPVLALTLSAWWSLRKGASADWATEARPGVDALLGGHLAAFFQSAPAYGGSLLLRAPFMAIARLWGGGAVAVYAMGALPCLMAMAALALWLGGDMKRRGCGVAARTAAVLVCSASPLAVIALADGHPEELLGGVLCVAAVLCAQRERAAWSGVLLGLAIANKDWGVLAAGPVLIALSQGRGRALACTAATAGLLLAPFVLIRAGGFVGQTEGVALHAGGLFGPFQLWWFLGTPVHAGARIGPGWLAELGHTLPIAIMVPLTLGHRFATRGFTARRRGDAMLLLALLLLLRCALDPWDAAYYPVPFLTALLAWDATSFDRGPVIAASGLVAAWFVCQEAVVTFGGRQDALATGFAVAVLPSIGAIFLRLFRPPRRAAHTETVPGQLGPLALRRH